MFLQTRTMGNKITTGGADEEPLNYEGCRRLVLATLLCAIKAYRGKSRRQRLEAYVFLTGRKMERWAELAGVDPERVRARVLDADVRVVA